MSCESTVQFCPWVAKKAWHKMGELTNIMLWVGLAAVCTSLYENAVVLYSVSLEKVSVCLSVFVYVSLFAYYLLMFVQSAS